MSGANDLSLVVTLARADPANPDFCGVQTSLDVKPGEDVNLCYTMTNNTDVALNLHTLGDTLFSVGSTPGDRFVHQETALAPGASLRYNRIATVGDFSQQLEATWTALDALPGYTYEVIATPTDRIFADEFDLSNVETAAFVDVSTFGSLVSPQAPADTIRIPVYPFPLRLFGDEEFGRPGIYQQTMYLCMGNAGVLQLNELCADVPWPIQGTNEPLPSAGLVAQAQLDGHIVGASIAPFWDSLSTHGAMYYAVLGEAPSRRFVVQWNQKSHQEDPDARGVDFEIVFAEEHGGIDFRYRNATFGSGNAVLDYGASATIGLQAPDGRAVQFSYDEASLSDGMTVRWAPTGVRYTARAEFALHVVSPGMTIAPDDPGGISMDVAAGSIAAAELKIGNSGDGDLNWTLREAAVAPLRASAFGASVPYDLTSATTTTGSVLNGSAEGPVPAQALRLSFSTETGFAWSYVGFDALLPQIQAALGSVSYVGDQNDGDFVDGDFGKEYLLLGSVNIATIDTQTGALTQIAETDRALRNMKWDPTTHTMYATALPSYCEALYPDQRAEFARTYLYRLDLATGVTTEVGYVPGACLSAIAIDRDGQMFGVDNLSENGDARADLLYAIDKETGYGVPVGPLGVDSQYLPGMDFDDTSNTLYFTALDGADGEMKVFTIDTSTGRTTEVGATPSPASSTMALAIARGDESPCAQEAGVPWFSASPVAGTTLPDPDSLHPSIVTLTFDATALTPGEYTASVCVYGNDPDRRRASIPLHLRVH